MNILVLEFSWNRPLPQRDTDSMERDSLPSLGEADIISISSKKREVLDKYLTWYEKSGRLNTAALAKQGMPKNPQRKPGSIGRASKRKSTSRIEIGTEAVKRQHTYENECTAENDMESNYFLKFVTGTKIRVCYGCAKTIHVPPYAPAPPYDVVICRKEYRSYLQDGVPKLTLTPQNVHYHLREIV